MLKVIVYRWLTASMTAAALFGAAAPASAQYFGQNKVQYKTFDFQVLKTEHFDIYFYPSERAGIDASARLAERWVARLERVLGHKLRGRQPLVLYASHVDFEQTNIIPGELGEGTGGVTEPLRRRIVLPLAGPLSDTDHVIGHELVHAFQFDITSGPNSPPGQNGAERLPLWFIEGMAEYLSLGPIDPNTAMWLRDAARQEKLPSIADLDDPKYFPYRWGQAFWAYVGGRWGDDVIRQMLATAAAAGDVNVAIEKVLGLKTKDLSSQWQAAIRQMYQPVFASTTPPGAIGKLVIKAEGLSELNVGPAVSPDGRLVAFLSQRDLFSIDLYVAEVATGRILHKLTSTASDPHYSSIQFIYSAGGWDKGGKRLAIATVTNGRPALSIFNAVSGKRERDIPLPDLDEIFTPTWAPDGHAICFTGMGAGLTDLYVYDLNASTLRRLTNDAYADLQPAWSPDGRRIAFATDRFSSRLDSLDIGPYRLGLIDPESGRIEQVRVFMDGKNLNPQWSPDGQSLFFISDRDGIPNLYRVGVEGGGADVAQLTTVGTGLSGITNTSPALSVASATGLAAFSVYEGGKYDIYTLDTTTMRGVPPAPLLRTPPLAEVLPPSDRRPSEVAGLLANASFGLPAPETYPVQPYRASLSLEGVAQPSVGVGASQFGAAIGGGIAMQFGDMLENHSLIVAAQISSGLGGNYSFNNTAVRAAYFNQAHRWNYGVIAGQVPYLTAGFASGVAAVQGQPAEVDQTIIFRQTERSASGVVAYPFNRAQRVEFQGGVSRISFDQIVQTTAFSLDTGQILVDSTETIPAGNTLTLGTSSAALVYDTSNFGATSPVQGQRYRLEASPTFGSINFTSLLADYRRYFMPASFYTFAGRIMHYGRYGSGGEDARLFPLYIGYPNLVRGYDVNSFDGSECIPNATSQCPLLDRLVGSRLLVANLEFRFPLLRPFGVSQRMYGPVPVEVALFADGGITWNNVDANLASGASAQTGTVPHSFKLSDGVSSAGVALRVNLLGFAVGEFDFARPFQRPGKGWVFQFNLSPGF
jgi:hypothetical protein